jgi:hypothetical protein
MNHRCIIITCGVGPIPPPDSRRASQGAVCVTSDQKKKHLTQFRDQIMTGLTVIFDKDDIPLIPEEWVMAVYLLHLMCRKWVYIIREEWVMAVYLLHLMCRKWVYIIREE